MSVNRGLVRTVKRYLIASICCLVFSTIYEAFSHDVYSANMICVFLWPLLLGFFPFFVLSRRRLTRRVGWIERCVYHSGVATLTMGSAICGVFEIYGTTSPFTDVYWIVGGVLSLAGIVLFVGRCAR